METWSRGLERGDGGEALKEELENTKTWREVMEKRLGVDGGGWRRGLE